MKKVFLVCNAHIDPVWQWDWDEGVAATLSTFYSAVNLFKNYDYVFNHNEVLLYEYMEKYDPKLFKEIQELVKQGKWKIMGGWYIQPDCMIPSGESFIRQISLGREYFKDKFDVRVTTANNFDAFAHTRGLASILKHCGYDSYVFTRPMPHHDLYSKEPLPVGPFLWKGYDGSTIKALRFEDLYLSAPGKGRAAIEKKISKYPNEENICVLWGVGNHGGGASRSDLDEIKKLQEEKKGEYEIIHSNVEDYFKSVNPDKVVSRQLICLMKSFSSVSNIKQAHDNLENALYLTEKICTIADLESLYHYNKEVLKNAERVLCQIEFHDVLSGTAIKLGTDSSLRKVSMALESLKAEFFAAFNALAERLPKVLPDDENLVFFNPFPYEFHDYVTCEFYAFPALENVREQSYKLIFYDMNHNEIPYQIVKEESELNSDRRKKVILDLTIPACSVTSIGVHKEVLDTPKVRYVDTGVGDIIIKDFVKEVVISRDTGLLKSFKVNDIEYLAKDSCAPMMFNDDEDPWGWNLTRFDEKRDYEGIPQDFGPFKQIKIDNKGKGVFDKLKGVTVLEDGKFLTEVQALFSTKQSHIVIKYKIYKDKPYMDISLHTLWNEAKKGLKLKFSLNGDKSYFAQAAYGVEKYKADKKEQPSNRYVGVMNNNNALVIYNNSGIHSVAKRGNDLTLTLLNGSVYCAHPMFNGTPIIAEPSRYLPYIEQGVHDFNIRLRVNKIEECERYAKEFNEQIYGLYYFPHGNGDITHNTILISNENIVINALKRRVDGTYLIRLYNGSDSETSTTLNIRGMSININFKKYTFKTFVYNGNSIVESDDASIY